MATNSAESRGLITHRIEQIPLEQALTTIRTRILETGDKPSASVQQQLEMVDAMSKFNLGRYLLINQGVNGYWTRYVVMHPQQGRLTGLNDEGKPFSALESWLLDEWPQAVGTQDRFVIFQQVLQNLLRDNLSMASLPCGAMEDLLGLDFKNFSAVNLVGIDLDEESLKWAEQNAQDKGLQQIVKFIKADAWNLGINKEYDVLTSNGLNVYETDPQRLIELYEQYHQALKRGGTLVTSFMTPPPEFNAHSPWDQSLLNEKSRKTYSVFLELFSDRRGFQLEDEVIRQLQAAGFKDIEVIYDSNKTFPTVTAKA
ncbi:MAG: class I SAM-dependent methyltransferase [Candidatus Thiodiazotropha taylori]|nr:class I SAM-dependent methyltransferase [Candidatus Thiodiazotropha taylori]MCG8093500.1 class I SAM-dependent methyltransferase [Candidatus Thiodiazotropha endolucinida]MCG7953429.1 class I SAM-dependent methyltransferase [Candidatus Thiodiazotropha taylori]MCG8034082.1 class I SAM-dependent methyltransferase [Candidatus Thiodiazotropha taylori]MCG8077410.1 class I SAM-dependent methyltransferase [Candidatus Thiodiazotropha taylori]